jgi:hypothetical protein
MEGWRLGPKGRYRKVETDDRGWLWCEQLELWLGTWEGSYLEFPGVYPRFFDREGNLVLIAREDEKLRADAQAQRADAEKQRADAAEAELARLKAKLTELEGRTDPAP